MELALAAPIGLVVGLVLGMLGAGGSLLTVPALIFLLGLDIKAATGTSLVVVSAMAVAGVVTHARADRCKCKPGFAFGAAGAVTAAVAGLLASSIPDQLLNGAFALLLLGTAVWLWARRDREPDPDRQASSIPKMLASGAGVGVLTGILGVGGGFIIVPALIATLGLSMEVAVGTSQLVILINALAGLAGRAAGASIEWGLGAAFAAGGVVGTWAGSRLSERFDNARLKIAFAGIAVVVAVAMALQAVTGGGPTPA